MAFTDRYLDEPIRSPSRQLWRQFRRNPFSLLGLWGLSMLMLIMLLGPWLAPFPAEMQNQQALLLPPSWADDGVVRHFLGTDDLGRDIWSRLLHGAHLTFGSAILVVGLTLTVGFAIGAVSGTLTGLKSSILGHLLDALLSIPSLLLAILFAAVLGPGLSNVLWAVGLALLPQFVHTVHHAIHDEMQKAYVTAARLDGANRRQIFWFVVMPNVWDTLIVTTTLSVSVAILDIAALGFLGLGAQSPTPEWGAMVAQSMDNLLLAPWTITIPGFAILFSVLAINLVGDGLRSALNALQKA
ncbi:ABC transporter permease subunit [Paraferrimonas sedimenticola]|uniref:Antimicrobial peptide ABC transporter permease SapC n=1 Tax=Paraferrimonas sedimenticola TaxID=375674 RepID=A0AA37VSQ1_9GAMM|nr:ABC transporter permease subunit [Paraferrimonas sedimenticola]GLP94841.1 antimicrobial peptide ABC transporter permease SapC [Paraferrimonas sedimenticola]